ncbi:MAG TPA: amylo-alpha-1,6-glucosidase [Chthonomonadaceae bacterium]|nr:amylo-alpha-1,6-glucosidase [Chthonomonadaceae bacterium]
MKIPNIALDSAVLRDDAVATQREWLVTNGMGGYASATVSGANTRRYHGLLVAALNPPVGRAVLLSKLEETLEIVDAEGARSPTFALSTNLYPGILYPQGHHLLESWVSDPAPTWVWSPWPGVRFEKRVWMAQGHNAVYIAYRLLDAPAGSTAHLHLVPLLAWRDYHSEMKASDQVAHGAWFSPSGQVLREPDAPIGTLRITLPGVRNLTDRTQTVDLEIVREDGTPHPETTFASQPYWYYSLQHPREQERGMDWQEDLFGLGMLSVPLAVGECVVVVASLHAPPSGTGPRTGSKSLENIPVSLPPPAPEAAWKRLQERRQTLSKQMGLTEPFAQGLALAADQFVVQVPGGRSTLMAGYPWFSDWGRDTMISLPGLCLATGRPEIAREILLTYAGFVDQGMLPNRFPDGGTPPDYNTVDATLWYFVAAYRYWLATGDSALIRDSLWSVLEQIVHWHQQGTRYNIHVAPDSLLYAGQSGVQLTWMDAKVGDWVVTPRIGKPVEINALWHNALRTMAHFARVLDKKDAITLYSGLAQTNGSMFSARFTRHDGRGLCDVLDTPDHNAPDEAIRPNQVFAVSLPFAPLEPDHPMAKAVVQVVAEELLTPFGLRTLSPYDPAYRPYYGGDAWSRDSAYHQGTVWPWLLGPYVEAHYKVHKDADAALEMLRPLQSQLTAYCLGSLAEVYDGGEVRSDAPPQRPNGCYAQAWSVGEILRIWKELVGKK